MIKGISLTDSSIPYIISWLDAKFVTVSNVSTHNHVISCRVKLSLEKFESARHLEMDENPFYQINMELFPTLARIVFCRILCMPSTVILKIAAARFSWFLPEKALAETEAHHSSLNCSYHFDCIAFFLEETARMTPALYIWRMMWLNPLPHALYGTMRERDTAGRSRRLEDFMPLLDIYTQGSAVRRLGTWGWPSPQNESFIICCK